MEVKKDVEKKKRERGLMKAQRSLPLLLSAPL